MKNHQNIVQKQQTFVWSINESGWRMVVTRVSESDSKDLRRLPRLVNPLSMSFSISIFSEIVSYNCESSLAITLDFKSYNLKRKRVKDFWFLNIHCSDQFFSWLYSGRSTFNIALICLKVNMHLVSISFNLKLSFKFRKGRSA